MPRSPMTVTLPPFHGMTRRIILTAAGVYLALGVLGLVSSSTADLIKSVAVLHPDHPLCFWQYFTYPFINFGLLSLLLACLSLWFVAGVLEDERGPKWLAELFLASTAGGGLLMCLLSRTVFRNDTHGLEPTSATWGLWPAVLACILAYAYFHPDQELTFNFLIRLKAKYLAAIYVFLYLAMSLTGGARMHAAAAICAAVCGYAFLRLAPRRGFRHAISESLFSLRNAWYRRKRQRAAKKFTVYMRKQGKDVSLDSSGKYVSLEDERRDPADKRWMN